MPARTKPVPESAFLKQVIALARLHGWRVAHFRPARTAKGWRTPVQGDGKGWPDLVLVRGAVVAFAELKSDSGRLSPEQRRWIADLEAAGQLVFVWTPAAWAQIELFLSRRTP